MGPQLGCRFYANDFILFFKKKNLVWCVNVFINFSYRVEYTGASIYIFLVGIWLHRITLSIMLEG